MPKWNYVDLFVKIWGSRASENSVYCVLQEISNRFPKAGLRLGPDKESFDVFDVFEVSLKCCWFNINLFLQRSYRIGP